MTPSYVETALSVESATARQLVTQLQYLGLIDGDGKPTDIAEDWRHDDTYAKCRAAARRSSIDALLGTVGRYRLLLVCI